MAESVELNYGNFRLSMRPDLGGCIAGFWLGDVPVLRSTPTDDLSSVRSSASYALAPFSNRIALGRFEWQGVTYQLAQNFLPEPHAIHGVGWQRAWQVMEVGTAHASLSYQHHGDTAWPFAFDCIQTVQLGASGLTTELHITNRHTAAAPVGGGWHPYFVKRLGSHIRFSAQKRWEMGLDKLPSESLVASGLDTNCQDLDIDHCFAGWNGCVELHDELLSIGITSNLRHLVVFTHPGRDFVAIEPVSHVNNAINMTNGLSSLGLTVLEPGQTWATHMTIDVANTAPVLTAKT